MYESKNPVIFILSGKAESGKDELCNTIINYYKDKKVKKVSYAYYLKKYVQDISGWDGKEENKPRELLQTFGISFLKNQIDDKLLIRRTMEDVKVYSYFYDIIIITDARLKEEIEVPKTLFQKTYTIRINRNHHQSKLTEIEKSHITEIGLDDYPDFDFIIQNEGQDLSKEVKKIMEAIK